LRKLTTTSENALEDFSYTVRKLVQIFWKFKWVFLVVFVGISAAITYKTMSAPKVYSASTTVQINPRTPQVLSEIREVVDMGSGTYWASREFLQTQYHVISSRAVAERVFEAEGLDRDPAFLGLSGITDPKALAEAASKIDGVGMLAGRISVGGVEGSQLARIQVEDTDPDRAVRLSIAVARAYRDLNLEHKVSANKKALRTLTLQRKELQKNLEQSEQDLVRYKLQHGILVASLKERENIVTQDLLAYNAALARAESELVGLRAKLEEAKKKDPERLQMEELGLAGKNRALGPLLEAQERLRQERADMLLKYTPEHPKVVALDTRIQLVEKSIERERATVREQLKTKLKAEMNELQRQLRTAEATEAGFRKLLDRTNKRAQNYNKRELEYLRLQRIVDENRRMYALVTKRLKEIDLAKEIQYNNVSILDRARGAGLVRPLLLNNVLFAAVLGLFGGLAMVVLLNFFDRSVKTQDDVEHLLGLNVLGAIPTVREGNDKVPLPDLYVHTHPKSSVAELCRSVRTNIEFLSPDRRMKRLLITSSAPLEGKTTISMFLGISMAQVGNRVLLVSSDMRRPRVPESLGLAQKKGISNWIVGDANIGEILHKTEIPGLSVLPCGPIPPNPAEILHSDKFKKLVEELDQRFDRIIFDSPPIGVVSDPLILSAHVQGVILIIHAGVTTKDMVHQSQKKLDAVNAKLLGCILNQATQGSMAYGYYYYGKGQDYSADRPAA
jgi:capsular exopolysaccharide synthesis family protein